MRELLGEPFYRAHLVERTHASDGDDRILDSNKDAGIGASRWGASSGASGARRGDGPLPVSISRSSTAAAAA